MTFPGLLALLFVILASAWLLYLIFGHGKLRTSNFRKYLIGVAAVYLSGTIFIALAVSFASVRAGQFVVASELCVLFMFIMSTFTVIRLGKVLDELKMEAESRRLRGIVDELETKVDELTKSVDGENDDSEV